MADSNSTLNIILQLKDQASEQIKSFQGTLKDLQPQFKAMAVAGGAAFAAISGIVYTSVSAAGEAQAKLAAMDATLKATGKSSDAVRAQIIGASKAFVQLGFDDEDAAKSMAILFQRTNDAGEAIKLSGLAADLARAKHLDLETATKLVSLALSGQGRALLQYGIKIKDAATPLEALATLQEKIGGQAVAFAGTFEGHMEALKATTDNLRESIGNAFLPVLTSFLEKITPIIEHVTAWIEANPKLSETILIAGGIIAGLVAVVGTLGILLPAVIAGFTLLTGPVGLAVLAIGALIAVGAALILNWQTIKDNVVIMWSVVKDTTISAWTAIKDFFTGLWDDIKGIFKGAYDYIMNLIQPLISAVNSVRGAVSSIISGAGSAISSVGSFLGVHDAIIAPGGRVITTDPADYLIATKNPGGLGGVTVNVYGDVSGEDLVEKVRQAFMRDLRLDTKFAI